MKQFMFITDKCFFCDIAYTETGLTNFCKNCGCKARASYENYFGSIHLNINDDIHMLMTYNYILIEQRIINFCEPFKFESRETLCQIPVADFDFEFSDKDNLKRFVKAINLYLAFL